MGFIVGVFLFFIFIGLIINIIKKFSGGRSLFSGALKFLGPYIGFFIISGLIFIMGQAAGTLNGNLIGFFSYAAKILAVLTTLIFCLHLIVSIFRNVL